MVNMWTVKDLHRFISTAEEFIKAYRAVLITSLFGFFLYTLPLFMHFMFFSSHFTWFHVLWSMFFPMSFLHQASYIWIETFKKFIWRFHIFVRIFQKGFRLYSYFFHFWYLFFADLTEFESNQLFSQIDICRFIGSIYHHLIETISGQMASD